MNALILAHLIVVAHLPMNMCTTDTDCERVERELGCMTYSPDYAPDTLNLDADASGSLLICNRATFERAFSRRD